MIREYPIDYTISHYTEFDLYAEEGHRFCEGVDVFGDPYYSETPRTSILTRQTTGAGCHTAANGKRYMIPVVNSTIYGSFFYTDESVEGVPYTITGINTTMRQNTPEYEYPYEVSGMVLRHNTPDAISFSATDDWYLRTSDRMQIFYLVFPEDENNNREQAAFLFDPDYEWSL